MRRLLPALVFVASVLPACGPVAPTAPTAPVSDGKPQTGTPKDPPSPAEKPVAPLQLAVPAAPAEKLDGKELRTLAAGELIGRANQAMNKEDYPRAAAYQYWYVQKTQTGQYNLACFLAQIGQTDPAFYWLQRAASEEGVDAQHAQRDEDLASLRKDPRWARVQQYLSDYNRYFETAPVGRTALLVPKGYKKETPIAAVVWLHGLGSNPENFVAAGAQGFADELNVALIGVSGTKPRGPRSFAWAEDPEQDAKRLRAALAELSDRVTLKKGHVVLLGFSQGAQMGLEVAVSYPEEYAGAIVLSPGLRGAPHLDGMPASPLLAKRAFVLSCGAKEHPGNVRLTAEDADWLRKAKAVVVHKPYPGVAAHSFPEDFDERFPEWVKLILKTRGE